MTFYLDEEVNKKIHIHKEGNEWVYEKFYVPAGEISLEELNKYWTEIDNAEYAYLNITTIDVEAQVIHIAINIRS